MSQFLHYLMMVDHGGGDIGGMVVCPTESDRTARTSESAEFLELIGSECHGTSKNPGTTPLMYAAGHSQADKVKRLLHNGASVVDIDAKGWTALMYAAAASGSEDSVEVLLASGSNSNQASFLGNTPLMISAARGEPYERLLQAGANINAQNGAGTTLLMILAAHAYSDEIEMALKAGADPTLQDKTNRTALDYLHVANCGGSPLKERSVNSKARPPR